MRPGLGFNGVVIHLQHQKTDTNYQNLPNINTKIYDNVLDFGQLRAIESHPSFVPKIRSVDWIAPFPGVVHGAVVVDGVVDGDVALEGDRHSQEDGASQGDPVQRVQELGRAREGKETLVIQGDIHMNNR